LYHLVSLVVILSALTLNLEKASGMCSVSTLVKHHTSICSMWLIMHKIVLIKGS
jgi:hypothetical protein